MFDNILGIARYQLHIEYAKLVRNRIYLINDGLHPCILLVANGIF